jgi:hypothetical protein
VPLLNLMMALLLVFAAALQYNDPDPIPWLAIYLASAVVSLAAAAGRRTRRGVLAAVAVIALGWAAMIAFGGPAASEYSHMFDAWEMKSPAVEEAREATGLVIVAAWMAVLFIHARRHESAVQP